MKRDSGLARGRLQLEKVQKRVSNTGETRERNSMVCLVPETTIRNIELIFFFSSFSCFLRGKLKRIEFELGGAGGCLKGQQLAHSKACVVSTLGMHNCCWNWMLI